MSVVSIWSIYLLLLSDLSMPQNLMADVLFVDESRTSIVKGELMKFCHDKIHIVIVSEHGNQSMLGREHRSLHSNAMHKVIGLLIGSNRLSVDEELSFVYCGNGSLCTQQHSRIIQTLCPNEFDQLPAYHRHRSPRDRTSRMAYGACPPYHLDEHVAKAVQKIVVDQRRGFHLFHFCGRSH